MSKFVYREEKNNGNNKKKEFIYKQANGNKINDKKTLDYIKSLGCPPGLTKVEIDLNPNAEIACTGYDVKGKKQYTYSKKHNERVEKEKFCKLIAFGKSLPKIRKKYHNDLNSKNQKTRIIAVVLKVIESCNFRIGTDTCRKTYDHYGVTTLFKKHVDIKSDKLAVIDFIGKKGVKNLCHITDPEVVEVLKKIQFNASNKEKIFKYKNTRSGTSYITFLDINNYLKEFGDFTSKMFRTWAANKFLIERLSKFPIEDSKSGRKKTLNKKALEVGKKIIDKNGQKVNDSITFKTLHHTVAMSKKKYQIGELRDLYIEYPDRYKDLVNHNDLSITGLSKYECALMNFLNKFYKNKFCKGIKDKPKKNIPKKLNNKYSVKKREERLTSNKKNSKNRKK
jgi:DNA topoisomerase-1